MARPQGLFEAGSQRPLIAAERAARGVAVGLEIARPASWRSASGCSAASGLKPIEPGRQRARARQPMHDSVEPRRARGGTGQHPHHVVADRARVGFAEACQRPQARRAMPPRSPGRLRPGPAARAAIRGRRPAARPCRAVRAAPARVAGRASPRSAGIRRSRSARCRRRRCCPARTAPQRGSSARCTLFEQRRRPGVAFGQLPVDVLDDRPGHAGVGRRADHADEHRGRRAAAARKSERGAGEAQGSEPASRERYGACGVGVVRRR